MKNNIKERKIDLIALWKSFINPVAEELSQEETILASENISEEKKKELLKTLKNADKTMNKMFEKSSKTLDLGVNTKNIQIDTKNKVKNNKEKEVENKDQGREIED
jgi:hypothetical protein